MTKQDQHYQFSHYYQPHHQWSSSGTNNIVERLCSLLYRQEAGSSSQPCHPLSPPGGSSSRTWQHYPLSPPGPISPQSPTSPLSQKPGFGMPPGKMQGYHAGSPLVILPSSMRTIPFTVPSAPAGGGPGGRGRSSVLADQDTGSTGSGSEPTTPSNSMSRGSMDSIFSQGPETRGAYSLGSIDPSLYRTGEDDDDYDFGEGHIGRLWFAIEYERESEKLKVDLIKAKNVPSRVVGSINGCDPFCRIYLMPDERRYLQTKFKKKTCNPKFEESFVFQVSNKTIEERVLKFTLFDLDRHKRHNVIGHALCPLRDHNFESNERVVIWRDLEREVSETTSDRGEIHISLAYNNHLERLTVCVFEGKEFKKPDMSSTEEFYVKVCLQQQNKVIKNKRTDAVKRTTSPVFNESFTFKIAPSALDTASISINALQHLSGQKDKLIGRVVLGSFMFARGKELEHWNEMIANQREQISHWHTLT